MVSPEAAMIEGALALRYRAERLSKIADDAELVREIVSRWMEAAAVLEAMAGGHSVRV